MEQGNREERKIYTQNEIGMHANHEKMHNLKRHELPSTGNYSGSVVSSVCAWAAPFAAFCLSSYCWARCCFIPMISHNSCVLKLVALAFNLLFLRFNFLTSSE